MAPKIDPYLEPLREIFSDLADPAIAVAQKAYMKNKFEFFGIKTPDRRMAMREYLREAGHPVHDRLTAVIRSAWAQPQREFQYVGMELFTHAAKKLGPEHLPLAEYMILQKSWWDTVDHLAVHGVGKILSRYPEQIKGTNQRYLESNELWLQRTALIFQLQYKAKTDRELLFQNIRGLAAHPDFFIRKGIGWSLRQYAYVDKKAVIEFVESVKLSPLSVREALKHVEA